MKSDEATLLAAWGRGDKAAGEELFARYYEPLTRFFINKVRTTDEVEELTQHTFMAIVESAPRYRGDSSVRTWVFAIARNLLRQFYAKRKRDAAIDATEVSVADFDAPGPSTLLRGKTEQRLLLSALRRLPLETQVMLELFYWEDMTSREIGEILGMPEGTTRSRLRKARSDLRDIIETLASSPREFESTVENLAGWAQGLREIWGI